MSGHELIPDVRREDELDRLIRWALYNMVAHARPSPAVWHNIRLQLSPSPSGAVVRKRQARSSWQRSAHGLLTWTTSALAYVFDQEWDERFAKQRNSRRWYEYLALVMPSMAAITVIC